LKEIKEMNTFSHTELNIVNRKRRNSCEILHKIANNKAQVLDNIKGDGPCFAENI